MLIEPSATNLLTATQEVSSWSSTNVSVTSNTTTAPDGSQTGDTVTRTAAGADVRQTKAVTSGTSYTMSIFAKAETDNQIQLDFSDSSMGADNVEFNTRTGQKVSGSANYSITQLSNGWRRYSFTSTCISSGNTGVIIRIENDEPVQLWGFQFEEGSVATSYIPTSGSAVTRQADDLVIDGSDFTDFYNGSEGTFYMEIQPKNIQENIGFVSGQNSDSIFLYSNLNSLYLANYDGVNYLGLTPVDSSQLNRMATTYSASEKRISLNGSETSGAYNGNFATANMIYIGRGYWSYSYILGHIKRLIYWPTHSSNL